MNNILNTDNNEKHSGAKEQNISVEAIKELGTITTPTMNSKIHFLTIIGQIEGHMVLPPHNKTTKYEHIIPQLIAIEESQDIEGLLLVLNTVGGDVEAGLAIAEMISTMSKPTVSLVLGGGHSIGVPLSVCTNYSFIAPSATMTIHPIRITGMVLGISQTYDYLNKMQRRVVDFITRHSNVSEDELYKLMTKPGELANDVGTVLIGQEAVNIGLINEMGGLTDALDKLKTMIDEERGGSK